MKKSVSSASLAIVALAFMLASCQPNTPDPTPTTCKATELRTATSKLLEKYTYNGNYMAASITYDTASGSIKNQSEFTYTGDKLTSYKNYDGNNRLEFAIFNQYGTNGFVTRDSVYVSDSISKSLTLTSTYTYNSNDEITEKISQTFVITSGVINYRSKIRFDYTYVNGKATQCQGYEWNTTTNAWNTTSTTYNNFTYEYDVTGKLTKKLRPDNSHESYTYDSNGNLTSRKNYFSSGTLAYSFEYEFDDKPTPFPIAATEILKKRFPLNFMGEELLSSTSIPENNVIKETITRNNFTNTSLNGTTTTTLYTYTYTANNQPDKVRKTLGSNTTEPGVYTYSCN